MNLSRSLLGIGTRRDTRATISAVGSAWVAGAPHPLPGWGYGHACACALNEERSTARVGEPSPGCAPDGGTG